MNTELCKIVFMLEMFSGVLTENTRQFSKLFETHFERILNSTCYRALEIG